MRRREPQFLAATHLKGGSGATSVAVNVAAGLALRRHPTLLLDLDPVAAATFHLVAEPAERTLADVLEGRAHLTEVMRETAVKGLLLAPGSPRLASWDRKPQQLPVDLHRTLTQVPDGIEIVLLDLPPSAGAIVRGTLAVLPGGAVLAPVQARGLDLVGFSDLLGLLEEIQEQNPDLYLAGVVPVRTNRTRLSTEVVEALKAEHGRLVLPSIRDATAVARAPLEHRPIQLSAPRSPAAEDFAALTGALLSKTLKD